MEEKRQGFVSALAEEAPLPLSLGPLQPVAEALRAIGPRGPVQSASLIHIGPLCPERRSGGRVVLVAAKGG